MRVPQVNERVKELPAQALRGVFAGVGQLLLITDKIRNKTPAGQQAPQARGPERSATVTETPKAAPAAQAPKAAPAAQAPKAMPTEKAPEVRDLDKTGNVRLLGGAAAGGSGAATAADATEPPAEEPGVPLPNYDELPIASLRARLRNMDVEQVKRLAEYERAHAGRADVIAMFDRRIAKLEAQAGEDAKAEAGEQGQAEAQEKADTEAQVEAQEEVAAEVREEVEGEAEEEV